MSKLLVRFVREEDGQDLVEYAFLIVFIALVAAVGLDALGVGLDNLYDQLATSISGLTPPAVPTPGG